jgi:hypothetical protein
MRGALLNPVRFYPSDAMPDYISIFPNFDNTTLGDRYFFGVNASPVSWRVHVGNIYFQFLNEDNEVKHIDVYKHNESNEFELIDVVDTVDISPVGWVGYQIHKLSLTGLADGFYYLQNDDYKSDIFQVTSSSVYSEDYVKIKYSNSINDFGCIFGTNYFEAYFIGSLEQGEPSGEKEVFARDGGGDVEVQSSGDRTVTLTIIGVHQLYKDVINTIFLCDTKEINGVLYTNSEFPQWSKTDGGDTGNIVIKLKQVLNDYYHG